MIKEVTINDFIALTGNPLSLLTKEETSKALTNVEKNELSRKIKEYITENSAILFECDNKDNALAHLSKLHIFCTYLQLDSEALNAIQLITERIQGPLLQQGCFQSCSLNNGIELRWKSGQYNSSKLQTNSHTNGIDLQLKIGSINSNVLQTLDNIFPNHTKAPVVYLNFEEASDNIDDSVIATLASRNPNIKGIYCENNEKITIKGVKLLAKYANKLDSLSFKASVINDHWLQVFAQFQHLHVLHLHNCTGVTTAGMSYLPKMPLRILTLDNISDINDRNIGNVGQITSLVCLTLKKLPSVYSLKDTFFYELIRLQKLQIISMQISDQDLESLEECQKLTTLSLSECGSLTEKALDNVGMLDQLLNLDISHTSIATVKGLGYLRSCTQLKNLDMSYCKNVVGEKEDTPLEPLQDFRSLQILDISGWQNVKADDIVPVVEHCTTLTGLSILECFTPDAAFITKLKEIRPKISIDHDEPTSCPFM